MTSCMSQHACNQDLSYHQTTYNSASTTLAFESNESLLLLLQHHDHHPTPVGTHVAPTLMHDDSSAVKIIALHTMHAVGSYRKVQPIRKSISSLFGLHNETGNIYTHLLGESLRVVHSL